MRRAAEKYAEAGPDPETAEERREEFACLLVPKAMGEVEFPSGFRPTQIEEDAVLGIRRDELEVEYVELYRLEKPSAGRSARSSTPAEAKPRMTVR